MGKGWGGVISMVHNAFQEASNLTPQSDTQIREKKRKRKGVLMMATLVGSTFGSLNLSLWLVVI